MAGRVTCCVASAGPGFEADGASVFYCGGGASGTVRAVRKPKPAECRPPRLNLYASYAISYSSVQRFA